MAGVAIDSIYDMRTLFSGIPLDSMSVSMTMNGAVLPVLALFIVAAEEQGVPMAALSGTIQNDILKEFMVRNTYIYPPAASMRIVADIFAFTAANMPKFNSISISGYHMQEAGATQDLELAYTLADGIEYIRAGIAAGMSVDRFAPRLSFFWAIGMNFFMEVAKLRAARKLWAEIVKGFGAKSDKSLPLRAHSQTSGWSLTAQDPFNNVIRTQIEAMAATQGHTQSLHTNALDEALALPTPFSARIARNTQLFLIEESGTTRDHRSVGRLLLCRAPDRRARGAGAEPYRRDRVARRHGQGDRAGPAQAAHRGGRGAHSGAHRLGPADGDRRQCLSPDRRAGAQRAQSRRGERARDAGGEAQAPARRTGRGEDAGGARGVDGGGARQGQSPCNCRSRPRAPKRRSARSRSPWRRRSAAMWPRSGPFPAFISPRLGRPRANARVMAMIRAFAENEGQRPRILVAKMGQDGHDRGQKIIASAFADLGFDVKIGPLFATPEEVAALAAEMKAHIVGVSSLAAGHLALVPALKKALGEAGMGGAMIVVGGVIPERDFAPLRATGAEAIFPPGTMIAEAAESLIEQLNQRLGYSQRAPA